MSSTIAIILLLITFEFPSDYDGKCRYLWQKKRSDERVFILDHFVIF